MNDGEYMKISLIQFSRSFLRNLTVLPLLTLLYSAGAIQELPYSSFEGKRNTQIIKIQETPQSLCASRINSVSSILNFLEFHSKVPSLHTNTISPEHVHFQSQPTDRLYPKPLCDIFHLRI
jgi:hypothetical protein